MPHSWDWRDWQKLSGNYPRIAETPKHGTGKKPLFQVLFVLQVVQTEIPEAPTNWSKFDVFAQHLHVFLKTVSSFGSKKKKKTAPQLRTTSERWNKMKAIHGIDTKIFGETRGAPSRTWSRYNEIVVVRLVLVPLAACRRVGVRPMPLFSVDYWRPKQNGRRLRGWQRSFS